MPTSNEPHLKRSISLTLVTFYGIGTILGAGIYVLVGKVAGEAGMATPMAFLLASLLAGFSAFSYAELASRFPRSAGEAVYVQQAFGVKQFSLVMGLLIVAVGMVSAATLVHGFVGYLSIFVDSPAVLTRVVIVIVLGSVVAWGVSQSVLIAALLTVIEIAGLLIIIWVTRDDIAIAPMKLDMLLPVMDVGIWVGVFAGAYIAFYAFVGFEDIVNVAEEVVNPVKNIPRAIILSLLVTTLFYFIVSVASVMSINPEILATSDAPLAMIYEHETGQSPTVIAIISLLSVINGALVQIVMASRVLYGMSRQGWVLPVLGKVHPVTHTPIVATVLVSMVILILVLWLPLLSLAKTTSFITLIVFSLINLALLKIKISDGATKEGVYSVPVWVPLTGFIVCTSFVLFQVYQVL